MGLSIVTDSTLAEVLALVPLRRAKQQVGVAQSIFEHDAHLRQLINRARRRTESITRRAWLTQTWKLTLQRFPDCAAGYSTYGVIQLPRPPLASVTTLAYADTDNASQTLVENTGYVVKTGSTPGVIARQVNTTWPSTHPENPEAVTITYVAGYSSAALVPPEVNQAILALVDHWFNNRDRADVPEFVMDLLSGLHCGMKMGAYEVTA